MKTIIKILLPLFLFFLFTFSFTFTFSSWDELWDELWDDDNSRIPYRLDCINDDCLKEWIYNVRWEIWALEKKRKASEYIQDVVIYLITFLTLLAVIYIIYAWFNILTSAWDEEKAKNSKNIILYVIIWISIIWLAFPITKFIFQVLSWPNWT